MIPDLKQLASTVDKIDFESAILADTDGSYRGAVDSYLEEWKVQLKSWMSGGLAPEEYENLKIFVESLDTASAVVEFMALVVKLKQSAPAPGDISPAGA